MDSPFIFSEERERITFKGGGWVDIKKELSFGDTDELEQSMVDFRINPNMITRGKKGKTEISAADFQELEVNTGNIKTLELGIVAWSFLDEKDEPMPITPTSIKMLRGSIAKRLLHEIDLRNPEKKA